MITGVKDLLGSLNWERLIKIGTLGFSSSGTFKDESHPVATPLLMRLVGVSYSTKTAVIWTDVGYI